MKGARTKMSALTSRLLCWTQEEMIDESGRDSRPV